ncbi:MAG TPA: hypothetical protein VLE49_13745 [Anaerolineales bacterium]|nr:hypothetical protein [Anaerolineales bacterium]
MLSSTSRTLTYVSAIGYLLVGTALFLAPNWSAGQFPWNASSFVVMTIGGWCLGNAVFAWQSARLWDWKVVYPSLTYLWLFATFEAAVMIAFRAKVHLDSVVALGYVAMVGVNVLTALSGIIDVLRLRPGIAVDGAPVPAYVRGLTIFFTIVLSILALGGLLARAGGLSTEGGIFPEPLTIFSVRAFAAFFAAICLSALPLIWARNLTPMVPYGLAGIVLILPILIAAFMNLDKFDFSGRPGGILYIGSYIFTLVVTAWGLWRYRPALRRTERIIG